MNGLDAEAAVPATPVRHLGSWSRVLDLPRQGLMLIVRGYRFFLKPWLGGACRFEPTCSAYALAALERHGAATGSALTAWRLLRCHPGCAGGHDPVPLAPVRPLAGLFSRLLGRDPGPGPASGHDTSSNRP